MRELAVYGLGDMTAHYWVDDSDQVGLALHPASLRTVRACAGIGDEPYIAASLAPATRPHAPLIPSSTLPSKATLRRMGGRKDARCGGRPPPHDSASPITERSTAEPSLALSPRCSRPRVSVLSTRCSTGREIGHVTVEVALVNNSPTPVTVDALSSFNGRARDVVSFSSQHHRRPEHDKAAVEYVT